MEKKRSSESDSNSSIEIEDRRSKGLEEQTHPKLQLDLGNEVTRFRTRWWQVWYVLVDYRQSLEHEVLTLEGFHTIRLLLRGNLS